MKQKVGRNSKFSIATNLESETICSFRRAIFSESSARRKKKTYTKPKKIKHKRKKARLAEFGFNTVTVVTGDCGILPCELECLLHYTVSACDTKPGTGVTHSITWLAEDRHAELTCKGPFDIQ